MVTPGNQLSPEELELLQHLKDIKPPVDVPDYSFYLLLALIVAALVAIGTLLWFLIRFFRSRKKTNRRKELIALLSQIDFSDPKEAAYTVSRYGRELIRDENSQHTFEELEQKLLPYKYQKEVPEMSEEVQQYIRHFIGVVRD